MNAQTALIGGLLTLVGAGDGQAAIYRVHPDGTLTNSFRDAWFVPQKTSPERDIYTLLTA